MNTGQMFTVLGALMLLSMVSLAVNSMIIGKTTTMLNAQANLAAVSLAQSMLDEVMTCAYDGAVSSPDSPKVYVASKFSTVAGLGPSTAEANLCPLPDTTTPFKSLTKYNDVDDYHNYHRVVSTAILGKFTVTDSVFYVVETNPNQHSSTQTFCKKVVVTVRHPNMPSPLQLSDVAVYRRYF